MSEGKAPLAAGVTDLRPFYLAALACLLLLCALSCVGQVRRRCEARSFAGQSLERVYVGTFLLCAAADWLQGPFVYALYDSYGYSGFALASLFVTGFASAMLLGPMVGQFADRFGRKRSILLLYCGAYIAACVTKHFNVFGVLLLGRVRLEAQPRPAADRLVVHLLQAVRRAVAAVDDLEERVARLLHARLQDGEGGHVRQLR